MLIVFEGGEGSGKGTQIKLLREVLEDKGYDVLCIIEPGGTPTGQAIREILLNRNDLNLHPITEALLFSASRAQQVRTITKPALDEGKIVLSDRSYLSMYAYIGYARRQKMPSLVKLTNIAIGRVRPNLVLLFDLPPEIGLARKNEQKEINRIDSESLDFHKRVRRGYLTLAKKNPSLWKVIDATRPVKEIHNEVVRITLKAISKYKPS